MLYNGALHQVINLTTALGLILAICSVLAILLAHTIGERRTPESGYVGGALWWLLFFDVVFSSLFLLILISRDYPFLKFGCAAATLLNGMVLLANSSLMPVCPSALRDQQSETFVEELAERGWQIDRIHYLANAKTKLKFLMDRFYLPPILTSVASPGDIIMGISAFATMAQSFFL